MKCGWFELKDTVNIKYTWVLKIVPKNECKVSVIILCWSFVGMLIFWIDWFKPNTSVKLLFEKLSLMTLHENSNKI